MNVNNMTKYAVGILIGLVMLAGLVIPIVDSAQAHVGDRVTYNNEGATLYSEITADTTLTLSSTSSGSRVTTINDVAVTASTSIYAILTDKFVVLVQENGTVNYYGTASVVTKFFSNGSSDALTTILNGKTASINVAGAGYTNVIEWGYYLDPNGTSKVLAGAEAYVNSISNVTVAGYYSTGTHPTFYSYHNGKAYTLANYTSKASATLDKVEGTTDVYKMSSFEFTIEDELFTPYTIIVPIEINGHADSGANYTLIGVIPLVAIICLVVFAAGAIRSRRA